MRTRSWSKEELGFKRAQWGIDSEGGRGNSSCGDTRKGETNTISRRSNHSMT